MNLETKEYNFFLFSPNYMLAHKLYYLGNLKAIYIEKRYLNQDTFNFAMLREIPIHIVENIAELDEVFPKNIQDNSIGISFGTGLFFKERHIKKFTYGIWNIHSGNLMENRGRHPIAWSFINNDKYFYCTVHAVDEQIDVGTLIYEAKIERDINDNPKTVSEKIDALISKDLIEKAIQNFFNGSLKKIEPGKYNHNLSEGFKNIRSLDYTAKELFSIFKSQIIFGNVKINGNEYLSCDFYHKNLLSEDKDILECKDGNFLVCKNVNTIKLTGGGGGNLSFSSSDFSSGKKNQKNYKVLIFKLSAIFRKKIWRFS